MIAPNDLVKFMADDFFTGGCEAIDFVVHGVEELVGKIEKSSNFKLRFGETS